MRCLAVWWIQYSRKVESGMDQAMVWSDVNPAKKDHVMAQCRSFGGSSGAGKRVP